MKMQVLPAKPRHPPNHREGKMVTPRRLVLLLSAVLPLLPSVVAAVSSSFADAVVNVGLSTCNGLEFLNDCDGSPPPTTPPAGSLAQGRRRSSPLFHSAYPPLPVFHSPVRLCSSAAVGAAAPYAGVMKTLARGAFLRIASDLSGGTPFESVKTRVTTTTEGPLEAYRNIVAPSNGGFFSLWTGTPSRMVEGALVGAVFMLASTVTKSQLKAAGVPPTLSALAGGLVGGIAQAAVMTPAGMVFTTLNYSNGNRESRKAGHRPETAWSVTRRIVRDEGLVGMYAGAGPMCLRQASNWASRAGLTEVARTTLGMSRWGITGEIGSGVLGGLGSCWNTPIESVRILSQRDVSMGRAPKSIAGYWTDIIEREGYPGLFRGVTPRALQSVWQTIFMVVFPNLMGI
jgi:Mitochondrial carrier protein